MAMAGDGVTPQRVWDFGPGCKGFWVEAPKKAGQAPVVFRGRVVPGVPADATGWVVLAFYMHMHTYMCLPKSRSMRVCVS